MLSKALATTASGGPTASRLSMTTLVNLALAQSRAANAASSSSASFSSISSFAGSSSASTLPFPFFIRGRKTSCSIQVLNKCSMAKLSTLTSFGSTKSKTSAFSTSALFQMRFQSTQAAANETPAVTDATATATTTTTIDTTTLPLADATVTVSSTPVVGDTSNAAVDGAWYFVEKFQDVMMYVHDFTGTPWWITLVICTIVMRLMTLPIAAKSFSQASLMMKLKPYLDEFGVQLKSASTIEEKKEIQKKQMKFTLENGYKPFAMIMPVFTQGIPFLLFFLAIRQMVSVDPSFAQEGLFWFKDLSMPDVFPYVLPGITMLTMLGSTEAATLFRGGEPSPAQNVIRFMCIASFFITKTFPAGLHIYWITTNIFTFFQAYGFSKVGWLRKLFNVEPPAVIKGAPVRNTAKGNFAEARPTPKSLYAQKPKKFERSKE